MKRRLVEISYSRYEGYQVSTSNNGSQWNTIYYDKEFKNATTILNAFSDVGYDDISDYDEVSKKHDIYTKDDDFSEQTAVKKE
jgi:hypothetical protein